MEMFYALSQNRFVRGVDMRKKGFTLVELLAVIAILASQKMILS